MTLEEKYAHVTLESMEELEIGQIEDIKATVEEDRRQIEMALELLEQTGGVSREMATQFADYLPPTMVMESFTSQPTGTNYQMVKESLSTGLKVAIAVGVVAGLGALIWWFTKAANRSSTDANKDGAEKLEKRRDALKDLGNDPIAKIFKNAGDEPTPEQIAEWDRKNAEAERRYAEQDKKRQEDAESKRVMEAASGGLNQYTYMHLLSIWKDHRHIEVGRSLQRFYSKMHWTFDADFKEILIPAIDAAEKFSKSGKESDLEHYRKLLERRPIERVESQFNGMPAALFELSKYNKDVQVENVADSVAAFIKWATAPAKTEDYALRSINSTLLKNEYKVIQPDFGPLLREISKQLEVGDDLRKQEARIKALVNVPKEIQDALTVYIETTKKNVQAVDQIHQLLNLEVDTFNDMLKYSNRTTTGVLESTIQTMKDLIGDSTVRPKVKAAAMEALKTLEKKLKS